ncbi:MAG: 50S ribosomal protein L16 [Planctomycetes bacterium]|nr:50S ribosomal protein L16 [Planctomycetota bacterium]
MALMPKRMKYRKAQRGKVREKATRGNMVSHGEFGLQSLEHGWLTARQIEAGRMAATHFLQRQGRVYIRVFPHKPVSRKPLETRMGKGKGEPEYYAATVKEGTMLYEIGGVTEDIARRAFGLVAHKMPFRCRFVTRRHAV